MAGSLMKGVGFNFSLIVLSANIWAPMMSEPMKHKRRG